MGVARLELFLHEPALHGLAAGSGLEDDASGETLRNASTASVERQNDPVFEHWLPELRESSAGCGSNVARCTEGPFVDRRQPRLLNSLMLLETRQAPQPPGPHASGEVSEWLKEHAWKACVWAYLHREFESLPLRQTR